MRSHSTSPSTSPARQLVKAFAETATTEELVLYIAGTDNMLLFCQELLEQYDQETQGPRVQEVKAQCTARGVLPGALFAEVRKVLLALNRFHDVQRNHYAVLGLPEDADRDQVKKAYRTLSKQYHPDKQTDPAKGAQRFMEISGAYHTIMASSANQKTARPASSWRSHHPSRSGKRTDHKRFFLVLFIIVFLLVGASIFLAGRYNRNVLSHQIIAYQKQPPPNGKAEQTPTRALADEPLEQKPAPEPTPVQTAKEPDNDILRQQDAVLREEIVTVSAETSRIPSGGEIHRPVDPPIPLPPLLEPKIPGFPNKPIAKNAPASSAPPAVAAIQAATVAEPGSKAESPPKQDKEGGHPGRISAINTSLEISSLVNHYSSLYNSRDLDGFLALFSKRATENGNPLTALTGQYRSLFAHTREIDLTIADIEWKKKQDGLLAHGSFQVSYTYHDNKKRDYTGNIRFDLVRQQDTLKIRTLEYEFD